eukprot:TRINITY_DN58635_c0_g1_i1.p2 TRINITY_DN58635_c0_g1~~TRINITY_DN58635_c0_g1_i1.p2  ORF type:complete len:105 (-),score=7.43 TRINITY_DN58635_c0_g1_i1:28-342(-)
MSLTSLPFIDISTSFFSMPTSSAILPGVMFVIILFIFSLLIITYCSVFAISHNQFKLFFIMHSHVCLLYTSDAADDTPCVDLGGCRIIKKKKPEPNNKQSSQVI